MKPTIPERVRVDRAAGLPEREESAHRRSPWRQRFVILERGLVLGFRGDGSMIACLFGTCLVVIAGLVLGLPPWRWALLALSLTVVLSGCMFNQVLRLLFRSIGHHFEDVARRAMTMGTAAVYTTVAGAGLAIVLTFVDHFRSIFAG